ncbi:ABC transporter ATP-binding protein [Actinomadura sp. HBU206391]|uniref:ABC transporter ATP-binding protein n=1 Tax=Actinomadura sp. HBU206391 TaxID=2731692 RepID=UPI00164FDE58|nr:ABC transporter ATP-binding protein [Actinomadura sp. HBU206391]MBC6461938.1 ABC transporter ATP-binding protein [Actinomadura sp. HBU206391]
MTEPPRTRPQPDPGSEGQAPPDLAELERRAGERVEGFGSAAHIVCDNLVRIYKAEGVEVIALQGLDLLIGKGEMVGIVGASGSGKSTLLNILSGLDVPTAGVARVAGADLLTMSAKERLRFRRSLIGFVWQQAGRNLLPYLTAVENVQLPMRFTGMKKSARGARAAELLDLMGIGHCADRRPEQMSGGEKQRTAIAVSVANEPGVILADEPTGELDSATSAEVFDALRLANRELDVTAVVVTHDAQVAAQVDRTIGIRDGRTSSEVVRRVRLDDSGRETVVAEEYAVLDRAGRLQLPQGFTSALDMKDRVRLALEADHIGVWPTQGDDR